MTDEIVFYTHPMSRGRIVRWMLEELGQPYSTELLEYGTTMKSASYLAVNPMGKVPAIRHRGVVVTETAAICAYLADAFPGAGLAPAWGDPARGRFYRWLFFAAGPVETVLTNRTLGFEIPADKRAMAGSGAVEDVLDTLESAVTASDYVAGDRFSAADVYLASQLGWGMMLDLIEKRPAFENYWSRLSARPAAMRAQAIDDALTPSAERPPM